jgi:hypothetical protein
MTDPKPPKHPFLKAINENPIPSLILTVGTMSFAWAIVGVVFWRQIDGAANNFNHATTRMDMLFKDTVATSTNVQNLRDDFRNLREDLRSMRDDIRTDAKNLREDHKATADDLRRIREQQVDRETTLHNLRDTVLGAVAASKEAKEEAFHLRNGLMAAKTVEAQIIESYGVGADEQVVVKLENGRVLVSPLTNEKARQVTAAQFIRFSGPSDKGRSWWTPPTGPTDITASSSKRNK